MTDQAKLQRLIDKQDILECLTRFCRGMDRFDRESYLAAFWPDATMAAGPFVGTPEECWNWAVPMHDAGQILTHHAMLNNTTEIDGDTAHSETYYQFVARNRDESVWLAGGRYVDRLERRPNEKGGAEWRIMMRHNAIEWSCLPPSMPIPFGDVPGIGDNGVSARDRSDVSYIRPLTNHRPRQIPG